MSGEAEAVSLYQAHAVFKPAPPNGKLWRYSDLAKLVSVLGNRAPYFPVTSSFDDPYEGELPRILSETVPRDILPVMQRARFTMFVNCWHLNSYESAAMWQIYARLNEGVAIQSTFGRLISSFKGFSRLPSDLPPPTQVYAGMVDYIDYDLENVSNRHWALNAFSMVMHKRRSFQHENEVRAVCSISQNCAVRGQFSAAHPGIYVDCDLSSLIEAIYVSPLAPAFFRKSVEMVLERFELKVPVIQSDLMSKPIY
jgi:hypothetical protein